MKNKQYAIIYLYVPLDSENNVRSLYKVIDLYKHPQEGSETYYQDFNITFKSPLPEYISSNCYDLGRFKLSVNESNRIKKYSNYINLNED